MCGIIFETFTSRISLMIFEIVLNRSMNANFGFRPKYKAMNFQIWLFYMKNKKPSSWP